MDSTVTQAIVYVKGTAPLLCSGMRTGNRLVHLEAIVNPEGVFSTHKTIIDQAFHSRFIIGDLARSSTLESLEARLKLSKGGRGPASDHRTDASDDVGTSRCVRNSGIQSLSSRQVPSGHEDRSSFLELGYRGYNEHAIDWHLENFRLLLSGKVQAVADFNVFEKGLFRSGMES